MVDTVHKTQKKTICGSHIVVPYCERKGVAGAPKHVFARFCAAGAVHAANLYGRLAGGRG